LLVESVFHLKLNKGEKVSVWEILGIYTIVSIVCWGPTSTVLAHAAKFKSEAANFGLVIVGSVLVGPALILYVPSFVAIHLIGADPYDFPNRDTFKGRLAFAILPLIGIPFLAVALVMKAFRRTIPTPPEEREEVVAA
jgi:hypothetical protein